MLATIVLIVRRELLLAWRRRTDVLTTLVFFVIVVSLFPLGVGAEPETLRTIAPGVVWVAALLATLLSLQRLFAADHADGTLEQLVLMPEPLSLVVIGKVCAHWLTTGLPLVLLAPVLGLQFDLEQVSIAVLVLTLLIGTPALSLLGAVGAALTLGLRGGGVLLALLILPLYVPVLIFGAGAVGMQAAGLDPKANLLLIGAFLMIAVAITPPATAAALRIAME